MFKALDISNQLLQLFLEVEKTYSSLRKDLSLYDSMREDILHKLEFEKFNLLVGYILSNKLKETQQKRRYIKNELQLIQSLYDSIIIFKKDIEKANLKIRKIEDNQKCKVYHPRVFHNIF